MTKTAKQLDQELIWHACGQLRAKADQHVRAGMTLARAAETAIRETKALFPADWHLAVQGDDREDEVEVWEVEHKWSAPCARIAKETEAQYRERLVKAVKERARTSTDPDTRRAAKWSNAKLHDVLEVAMPDTAHDAFLAVVAAARRATRRK